MVKGRYNALLPLVTTSYDLILKLTSNDAKKFSAARVAAFAAFNASGQQARAAAAAAVALPVPLAAVQATRNQIASMFSFKKPASANDDEDSDDGSDDDAFA